MNLCVLLIIESGPGSSVGIVTELLSEMSGDGIPMGTRFSARPASCKMGTGSFPGVKCGRGVLLTTHPLLVPLPTLWATPGL